jgi:hypothetical protein
MAFKRSGVRLPLAPPFKYLICMDFLLLFFSWPVQFWGSTGEAHDYHSDPPPRLLGAT